MAEDLPDFEDLDLTPELAGGTGATTAPPSPFGIVQMSREDNEPVSLYLFRYGVATANVYGYTDAEDPITLDGVVYNPVPIGRGKTRASGGLDKSTLKIETSIDTEIVQLYLDGGPSYRTTLVIRSGDVTLPVTIGNFPVVFAGRVVGIEPKIPVCEIAAEPASTAMRGPGLRRHYQFGCPHVLYGKRCLADQNAVKQETTVSSFTKVGIVVPGGWNGPVPLDKFFNGYVTWTAADGRVEVRTILSATSGGITVTRRITNLVDATALTVFPGCNHQDNDCRDLHVELGSGVSNIVNFGGQKHIPTKNPIGITSQYY